MFFRFILALFPFLLLGVAFAQREPLLSGNAESPPQVAAEAAQGPPAKKKREGATFQGRVAVFRQAGGRFSVYFSPNEERFTCLENLCLERVTQILRDRPDTVYWSVDGQFTEYQGENFVLLRRAVLNPTAAPTDPSIAPGTSGNTPAIRPTAPTGSGTPNPTLSVY